MAVDWYRIGSLSPPILSSNDGSPCILFSRGTTRLINWPDGKRYSCLLQSLVVFLLLSLVSTLPFSRTGSVLTHLNSLTQQVLSIPTEERALPRHACCVLFRLLCNGHSLLLSSYFSRNGRIEKPSCSACGYPFQDLLSHCALSSYGLFAPLALWQLSVSLRPLVQALGSFPTF